MSSIDNLMPYEDPENNLWNLKLWPDYWLKVAELKPIDTSAITTFKRNLLELLNKGPLKKVIWSFWNKRISIDRMNSNVINDSWNVGKIVGGIKKRVFDNVNERWLIWITGFLKDIEDNAVWNVSLESISQNLALLDKSEVKMIEWKIKFLKDKGIESKYLDILEQEIYKNSEINLSKNNINI